jgi:hypothetical protein
MIVKAYVGIADDRKGYVRKARVCVRLEQDCFVRLE